MDGFHEISGDLQGFSVIGCGNELAGQAADLRLEPLHRVRALRLQFVVHGGSSDEINFEFRVEI